MLTYLSPSCQFRSTPFLEFAVARRQFSVFDKDTNIRFQSQLLVAMCIFLGFIKRNSMQTADCKLPIKPCPDKPVMLHLNRSLHSASRYYSKHMPFSLRSVRHLRCCKIRLQGPSLPFDSGN